jgi:hypothetical protein
MYQLLVVSRLTPTARSMRRGVCRVVGEFADALGSLLAEFAGPGPKFLACLVYVFLLYPSWWEQDRNQRAGDHAGDADQPRIAPELFNQLTGAVGHVARATRVIGVPARAIDYGGTRLAKRNYGAARRTRGLINPPFVSTGIAAMKWPTIRPEYLPSLPGLMLGTTTNPNVTSNLADPAARSLHALVFRDTPAK